VADTSRSLACGITSHHTPIAQMKAQLEYCLPLEAQLEPWWKAGLPLVSWMVYWMAYTLQHGMVETVSIDGNLNGWVGGRHSFFGRSNVMVGIVASVVGISNSR
jgi:hypothetical protein